MEKELILKKEKSKFYVKLFRPLQMGMGVMPLSCQIGSIVSDVFLAEAGNTYINSCLKIILVSCYHSDHYKRKETDKSRGSKSTNHRIDCSQSLILP